MAWVGEELGTTRCDSRSLVCQNPTFSLGKASECWCYCPGHGQLATEPRATALASVPASLPPPLSSVSPKQEAPHCSQGRRAASSACAGEGGGGGREGRGGGGGGRAPSEQLAHSAAMAMRRARQEPTLGGPREQVATEATRAGEARGAGPRKAPGGGRGFGIRKKTLPRGRG